VLEPNNFITEKDFQQTVINLAVLNGWLVGFTFDSRKSRAGEPDLRMVHPVQHRMIVAECKMEKGKLTTGRYNKKGTWLNGQDEWAQALTDCPGVEYYFWKPSMLAEIEEMLKL